MMNLPNTLSYLRLIGTFAMLLVAFFGNLFWTIVFYLVLGLTDVLDGWIARTFNLETTLGAKLDSLADNIFNYSAPIILYLFFPEFITNYIWIIGVIIGIALLTELVHFFKHSSFGYLHLYSAKLSALILYIFTSHALIFNPSPILFLIMSIVLILHFIEEIILVLIVKKPKANMKSLLHYLWK